MIYGSIIGFSGGLYEVVGCNAAPDGSGNKGHEGNMRTATAGISYQIYLEFEVDSVLISKADRWIEFISILPVF